MGAKGDQTMNFDEFTKAFQGEPPVHKPEKQVPILKAIWYWIQRVIATVFWGIIILLAMAVIADAIQR